jgi:hypothetical protein
MPRRQLPRNPDKPGDRPEVIVDFFTEQGLLFILLKNIGTMSAYRVTTRFSKPLYGLDGQKCISDLQLFRQLPFIPPDKSFVQLVDPIATWFKRRQPSRLTIAITYTDRKGQKFDERIVHDLRIYRELGYTTVRGSGGPDGAD